MSDKDASSAAVGPTQVEPEKLPPSASATNPLADQLNISLNIPEIIEIKMVDANALGDYEILGVVVSILSSALIGFFVAYIQARDAKASDATDLWYFCLVLLAMVVIAIGSALRKRRAIRKKGRKLQLRIASASEVLPAAIPPTSKGFRAWVKSKL